ncbi:3' terminal RNA ribose 2'-O-methyltransferase Hen1 [Microbispora bryophytorum]|uniref:Small RNA 2'-O-methyltransferase n=1 Tax=Microbispora bryophytorum TaxID=1460882 RepID=A0A8H9H2A0_9ACTN|nr:3' terminal RNA ribose 2'-O-methyltransferase Hen1 [Microbispora bryophytorum]MBD3137750.1 3' terminal RNA ribose 2'-O-methyltransferase Hen1 [Microbispora bryophytorum]TQS05510.1 3' terminal RNA ribose 2'-O-methyltransferase Hen1 [Microbispora bryophytorum]GGO20756.1 3' terminal RNA ribose 2'-O-methyltransferase Hen1 [Microbispora bryophytorum]
MLLTISTTLRPATDLGFLLHKHPDRVQEFEQSSGMARVFYPEAGEDRCTAALLLEIDPVRLARSRGSSSPDFSLGQYVNDRPYAASSLLASALADVFRTARTGRCASRQALADGPIPLEIGLPALPCRGGADLAHRLFGPLGWEVGAEAVPLDPGFPEWGESRYVRLALRGNVRLADALNHLYVLLPVLDDAKHYWLAGDEVDKLVRAGEGWLAGHPDKGLITRRYLGRRWALTRAAFARLAELGDDVEESLDPPVEEEPGAEAVSDDRPADEPRDNLSDKPGDKPEDKPGDQPEDKPGDGAGEERVPLNTLRREAVVAVLREVGARTVLDLGCGSGQLLSALLADPAFAKVAGMDVSARALAMADRRLRTDRMPDAKRARLELFQGSLTYTDARLAGYDAAVLMEVVEHVDPPRLPALERVVFGTARPAHVIVTTPNVEHNVRYELLAGARRHPDHRFEWSRAEFARWVAGVCETYGYAADVRPVGEDDPEVGPPTQMAVFSRREERS